MLGTSPRDGAAAPTPPPAASTSAPRLPHLTGLDGLRAVAVLAVILYHGDVGVLPGGFLGVDLFFVLSGFLITSLLLAEHRATGRIDLRAFWGRRFRRLLPALLVFLVAATAWAAFFAERSSLEQVRNDALAGLGYVANWWFVVSGASYGAAFSAPSPFQHLWSLAVEEQYYLLWPFVALVCLGTAALGARRGRRRLQVVSIVGFAASAGWMAWLAWHGADKDRMYFGTDTRAATILAGVVAALWLEPVLEARLRGDAPPVSPARRRLVTAAAAVGTLVLVAAMATASQRDLWLYRGGFPLVALAAAAMIGGVVLLPWADRALGGRALGWVGTRSYGLYLWHWLVLVALVTAWPRFTGWPRLVVLCLVAGMLAEISYRLVERPIRTHRVRIPRPRLTVPLGFAAVALLAVALGLRAESTPTYLQSRTPDQVAMEPAAPTTSTAPAAPEPTVAGATTVPAPAPVPAPAAPAPAPAAPAPSFEPPTRVLLVGDSVAASMADELGAALRGQGVAFADSAFPGCGIVEGDPAEPDGTPYALTKACGPQIAPNQRDVVARTRPDLVVALSTWEASDRLWEGTFHPFGTPESDDTLLALYRRTVDRLSARGARVAFVTVPDPVDSLNGPLDPARRERLRHLNGVLGRLAAEDPVRVSLIRLDDIVCPTDPCPDVVDGIALRAKDGTHYAEPESARYVSERLTPRILQVPRGDVR
ncbi:MAG: acyltransferase family protein [Microthrixaceae bacterium]